MTYTLSQILSPSQFATYRATFKQRASDKTLSPIDMLIYNMIRGLPLSRGFTAITNPNKLANGADPWAAFKSAKSTTWYFLGSNKSERIKWYFSCDLSEEQRAKLMEQL